MSIYTSYLRKKFWINDFLHGSLMWKDFLDIADIQRPGGIEKRQKYIENIISYAKANTTFYKKINGDALEDFPVINKQIILDHYSDFLVNTEKIPGQKGKIHIQKTSGSTGIPFSVYQDTRCRIRRVATIKFENEKLGFHSFEPMMHLRAVKHYWGDQFKELITYNKKLNIVYVDNANLTDEKVKEIIAAINNYKVKVVRGYMTTIDIITRYAVEHNLKLNYRPAFISVGEPLLESLRKRVTENLGCNIVSQYGNEENGIFGQSEINGDGSKIFLNRANCYIEILKFDNDAPVAVNELGRIVVTDFTNYAMPMIRYDIGDVGMIGEIEKNDLLSIKNLSGRKTDMIYKTNGEYVDFFNSITPDIYNNPEILQWQFIQNAKKSYKLKLCTRNGEFLSDDKFKEDVRKVVGSDANVEIEYSDQIPVLNSGKRKIVIQNYKQK